MPATVYGSWKKCCSWGVPNVLGDSGHQHQLACRPAKLGHWWCWHNMGVEMGGCKITPPILRPCCYPRPHSLVTHNQLEVSHSANKFIVIPCITYAINNYDANYGCDKKSSLTIRPCSASGFAYKCLLNEYIVSIDSLDHEPVLETWIVCRIHSQDKNFLPTVWQTFVSYDNLARRIWSL